METDDIHVKEHQRVLDMARFDLLRPNEADQPDPNLTQMLTLRANPTRLNPILDPEGPTQPKQIKTQK